MFNALGPNLIRHHAHIWINIWMRLSLNDIFTKYVWYLKPLIAKKIKNFLKVLNIKYHN